MSAADSQPTRHSAEESQHLDETFIPAAGGTGETQQMPTSPDSEEFRSGNSAAGQSSAADGASAKASSGTTGSRQEGGKAKPSAGGGSSKKKVTQLGDFKLIRKLGQGGMGTVYLARQVSLDRPVALKTLSKELAKNADAVKRFLREARSMAKLTHPNIVQVYAADSAHGFHFAALEFIDGKSMQDWMDEKKRLSVADALHVTLICADALRHAHEQNMVHRDIKPDNILITKDGTVKVSDFGLAKALDEDLSVTQSGTGLGTPLYMSPEQARNAKYVDQRSDIYALGITLYYFLTGEVPFRGESALEVITAKEQGKFTPARRLNPEIPERLDLMIDKMMAKDIKHRYSDCNELIRDLESLQLAGPALSFVEGAAASTPRSPLNVTSRSRTAVSGMGATMPTPSRSPAGGSTASSSARQSATETSSPQTQQKQWYVSYQSKDGKHHLRQMTTAEVVRGIQSGLLDLKTRAKKTAKDTLLPLAQFPEFVHHIEKLALQERTVSRGSRLQELYQEVDKYERRKKFIRFFKRIFGSMMGGVGLILWLAIIAGAAIGLYFLIPWAAEHLGNYFSPK